MIDYKNDVLLVGINAKYIHSSLGIWYLKNTVEKSKYSVSIVEFTINDSIDKMLEKIFLLKPKIIGFSCYIWNIETVMRLVREYKKINPAAIIFLGGPEVSYSATKILSENECIDAIIAGEAEGEVLRVLLDAFLKPLIPEALPKGLFLKDRLAESTGYAIYNDFPKRKSPYDEQLLNLLNNRILYYESSRGCPFSCTYCVSSTFSGVRYLDISIVKSELEYFIKNKISLVKFVDRTFNSSKERAMEIFKFIVDSNASGRFHFEIAGDLFDEEMINFLQKAPQGLFQFEIGIQSTNLKTIVAVQRKTNIEQILQRVKQLLQNGNIHIHLDLIVGLPYETVEIFERSFSDVYSCFPHQFQVGFLKVLPGTDIRKESSSHEYKYKDFPPYEILSNKYLSYEDIVLVKKIEDLVEKYYNSARFVKSLRYIHSLGTQPYRLYKCFSEFCMTNDFFERPVSIKFLYQNFMDFCETILDEKQIQVIMQLLKHDYIAANLNIAMPDSLINIDNKNITDLCFEFLKSSENIERFLPKYKEESAKYIYKKVIFLQYHINVDTLQPENNIVLYDIKELDSVTGLAKYYTIIKESY